MVWRHFLIILENCLSTSTAKVMQTSSLPKSYRPISPTSILCKLFEHLVHSRFQVTIISGNLLPIEQAEFQPHCSIEKQLAYLSNSIIHSFSREGHVLTIFFDLTKAFDTISKSKVIKKLCYWNISGPMSKFITNFLLCRKFSVCVGSTRLSQHAVYNDVSEFRYESNTLQYGVQ